MQDHIMGSWLERRNARLAEQRADT
jgi:hypothetical protein